MNQICKDRGTNQRTDNISGGQFAIHKQAYDPPHENQSQCRGEDSIENTRCKIKTGPIHVTIRSKLSNPLVSCFRNREFLKITLSIEPFQSFCFFASGL